MMHGRWGRKVVTGGELTDRTRAQRLRGHKRVQRTHRAVVAVVHPRWRSRRGDRVGLGAVRCGVRCTIYMFGFGGWPQP